MVSGRAKRTVTIDEIDLADADLYMRDDGHSVWELLRREAPIFWNKGGNARPSFWALTRYEDVLSVARDSDSFSSEKGNMLSALAAGGDAAAGRMLVVTDPPRHALLRQLVARAFTPRALERLEQAVNTTVDDLLNEAVSRGTLDFVGDVAARLPVSLICDLLGVPHEDRRRMLKLTTLAFASDEAYGGASMAAVREAHVEILLYYTQLAAERRRAPREDLVSILACGEVDGEALTDEEVVLNCNNLIIGGNETTRHAAAAGLLALIDHPDQWQRLKDDPSLLESAADEILRWTAPVMHVLRIARDDVEIRGQRICAGEAVTLWLASANRDEEVFPDGERFDIGRRPNRHVTFGVGAHVCLGAFLARLELRVLFRELIRRVERVELIGPAERIRSTFVSGIRRMPVELVRSS